MVADGDQPAWEPSDDHDLGSSVRALCWLGPKLTHSQGRVRLSPGCRWITAPPEVLRATSGSKVTWSGLSTLCRSYQFDMGWLGFSNSLSKGQNQGKAAVHMELKGRERM